jgi:MarR family transcriptional regulator, transcriptional regulator for hemolysin
MTGKTRRDTAPGLVRPSSGELSLDPLVADPMAELLMCRDRTDAASIRCLQRQIAAAPSAVPAKDDPGTDNPSETARLLQQTARILHDRCERRLQVRYPGMSWARCAVLVHLARHEGVKQAVLADSLAIKPIALSRLLDRLEADGLVARLPAPGDRRAYRLVLSAKAWPIIEYTHDLTRKTYDAQQLGISKAEASQLCKLLRRIQFNLTACRDETASSEPFGARSLS